jgi:hypothetical protein
MTVSSPPLLARTLLDAFEAFERAADNVPAGARETATAGLNSAAWTVAHVADQQDRFWNVDMQRLPRDAWLEANGEAFRPRATPALPPFVEARAALDRVLRRARACLAGLDATRLAEVSARREPALHHMHGDTIEQMLVRSLTHVFVHAGELGVIGALAGGGDAGLPGRLEYSRGLRTL